MAKASTRKKKTAKTPDPTGLTPREVRGKIPGYVDGLCGDIESDGGAALTAYRDPLGGHWVVLAALPIDQVHPTPYQRGLSDAHVKRLSSVIAKANWYLDPVIAVRVAERQYHTPNGHHRTSAMRMQGARTITALVVTEPEVARLILALNVEKAHNLRDKCQEVIRLARDLANIPGAKEREFSLEFEEPSFLTLGLCYEQRGRFGGSVYHPVLKRADAFMDRVLARAIDVRQEWAATLLTIDDHVAEAVTALKSQGLESPYLRNFVVARINPLRFRRGDTPPLPDTLDKMLQSARRFKTERISPQELARTGGAPNE